MRLTHGERVILTDEGRARRAYLQRTSPDAALRADMS
jgi:hypothetical protein